MIPPPADRNRVAQRKSSRAFSVIELLVAAAIISILGALLLPAYSSVSERNRRVKCLNNFHQLGIAMNTYAADHEGRFLTEPDPMPWYTYYTDAGFGHPYTPSPYEKLSNYLFKTELLFCPSNLKNWRDDYNHVENWGALNRASPSYCYRNYLTVNSNPQQILMWEMPRLDPQPFAPWWFFWIYPVPMNTMSGASGQFRFPFWLPLGWNYNSMIYDPSAPRNHFPVVSESPSPHQNSLGAPIGSNVLYVDGRVVWQGGDLIGPFYAIPGTEVWGGWADPNSEYLLIWCP